MDSQIMTKPAAETGTERGSCCPASANGQACDFGSLGGFEDLSGKVGHVEVLQCRQCGLGISTPPIPDVSFLYEGRESQDFQQDGSRIGHAIKRVAFRRQAQALLRQLGQRPARTLDFGCGSGLFTRCLGDVLGDGSVTGSDFESSAPVDLAGRPYLSMAELDAHKGSFDLVLAMHVLEHDDDPAALLDRICAMAKPGGTVVIEVPNVECAWVPIFGKAWDAWYLPFHRSHFSRTALRALAERQGYTVMAEANVCVPTIGRSMSNVFGGNKGLAWLLAGIAAHPVQWAGEKIAGRPSALRIILRTPG